MKGIVANHGYKAKRDWSLRVQRKKRIAKNFCVECGKDISNQHRSTTRCGTTRSKTGCAYEHRLQLGKKWKREHKYHNYESSKKRQKRFLKNHPHFERDRKRRYRLKTNLLTNQ